MSGKTKQSVFRSKLDQIISNIKDEIVSGRQKNGEYLPSETELAEKYNVSKYLIRKALDVLVAEGYVQKIPRIGNRAISPGSQRIVTIRFGYYPSMMKQTSLQVLIDRFHTLYPNIRTELIPVPFKFDDLNLMKHYLTSGLIDVAMFNHQSFSELRDEDGSLQMLEPLAAPDGIYPFLLPAFESRNRLRAVPYTFSPVILCYNKDHFHQYDLPEPDSSWKWTDLLDIAQKITTRCPQVGFYYHPFSENRWPIFFLQNGFSSDREWKGDEYDASKLKETIRTSRDLIFRQGISSFVSQSDEEVEELFKQQKISMIMTTYFALNKFADVPFQFDIAPLPSFGESRTLNIIIGLAVSRNTANKEAAKTLVHYMLSYEAQSLIRQNTCSIPALKKAAELTSGYPESESRLVKEPERFHLYREIIPSFRLHSHLNLTSGQLLQMRAELKLYWWQITDLETCVRHLMQILSNEKQLNYTSGG